MNSDEFKTIKDFSQYEMSENEEIRRKNTNVVLPFNINRDGYKTVSLNSKSKLVHRLLMNTYKLNIHNKPTVNHIDGIKTNNDLSNLEWATRKENSEHASNMGLTAIGERNGSAKLTNSDIPIIRRMLEDGIFQKDIATIFRVSITCISYIKSGKKWNRV